jgi:uroporphyrinogen decarboxylase
MAKMSSLERVATALQGKQPDRVPVATLAIARTLIEIGAPVKDAINDPNTMARAKLVANERFGDDVIVAGIDGCFVEAKAMGAKEYWARHMPIVDTRYRVIKTWEDVDNLAMPSPEEFPRMKAVIEEAGIIMEKVGDHIAIATIVSGPFSTVCNLIGHEALYRAMVKEPKEVHRLLEKVTDYSIKYHLALKGSTHAVGVLDPVAAADTTSPKQYDEFVKPYLAKNFKAILDAGMIPINHPCGSTTGILHMASDEIIPEGAPGGISANYGHVHERRSDLRYLKEVVGEVTLDPDDPYSIMLAAVKKEIGGRVGIFGNIDPIGVLLEGTPEMVRAQVRRNIKYAAEGGGFILASACDTAVDTPSANYKAMVEATKEFGVYD